MVANINVWDKGVVGSYINVDGAFGSQCWDLSQAWAAAIQPGCTLYTTQPDGSNNYPGLAAGTWEVINGYPNRTSATNHLRDNFLIVNGNEKGQPGDIIIWHYRARFYPISHTAVLLEDRGDQLYCLSQNSSGQRPDLPGYVSGYDNTAGPSGPSIYQSLPREGIAGFLRPRNLANTVKPSGSVIDLIKESTLSAKEVSQIVAAVNAAVKADGDKTRADIRNLLKVVAYEYTSGGVKYDGVAVQVRELHRDWAQGIDGVQNDGDSFNVLRRIGQKVGVAINEAARKAKYGKK